METGLNTESLIIAIACLGLGVAIGILIARTLSMGTGRKGAGSARQRQEQQDLATYQSEVIEHFTKTAYLLKDLDDSCRHLRQHLSDGAAQLATSEVSHQFSSSGSTALESKGSEDTNQADLKAPLDYAPGNGGLRGD